METPHLHNYPFDPEAVARIRAGDQARAAERLARRSWQRREGKVRTFLQWIAG